MNSTNYFLTKDGVISKLDTHWDNLRGITHKLEGISKFSVKKLFNGFTGSILFTIVVVWLGLDKNLTLTFLALISLGSLSLMATQFLTYLEFIEYKKKGIIIFDELSHELEFGYDEEEDISVDERILLGNFKHASQFPVNRYLYLLFLALLPIINFVFFAFYFFYA